MTEVRLYGHLRRFGKSFSLAVSSPAEAVRALCAVLPGFEAHIRKHSEPGYRIVIGKAPIQAADELHHPNGMQAIKIVPVVSGAASGFGKILAGAALVALSFTPLLPVTPLITGFSFSAASIAFSVGTSMILGGVSQMLAGNPQAPTFQSATTERPENQPSFMFNGPVNTTAQGNPVPICYGRMRVGSQVVSTGLSVAQLAV